MFSFLLYINTLLHDFVLDDAIVVSQNKFVQQGFSGIKDVLGNDSYYGYFQELGLTKDKFNFVEGGRYRPFSLILYAIVYQIFGNNATAFHFFNILFFALTSLLLYFTLKILLIKKIAANICASLTVSLLSTLLFIAHPIHTEAVANSKGLDEILSFAFSILSLFLTLKYIEKYRIKYLIFCFISFAIALLSKENAITFVAIIPLCIYYFRNESIKSFIYSSIPLLLASFIFFIIRQSILSHYEDNSVQNLLNNSFLEASKQQKFATIFYSLFIYLKLLFIPSPLTYDYYPYHIQLVSFANSVVIISLLFHVFIIAISIIQWRKKSMLSFTILYYLISLSIFSNIFFPIGVFMSERFLFMPSLAFCLLIGYWTNYIFEKYTKWKYLLVAGFMLIITSFTLKTFFRNKIWKDNETLFTTDVKVSFNSAKSNADAAGILFSKMIKTSDNQLKKQFADSAFNYYTKSLKIYNNQAQLFPNLAELYIYKNDINNAIVYLKKYIDAFPGLSEGYHRLGTLYLSYNLDNNEAIRLLSKGLTLTDKKNDFYSNLGCAYYYQKDYDKSIEMFENAYKILPDDSVNIKNLGNLYKFVGREKEATLLFDKLKRIKN